MVPYISSKIVFFYKMPYKRSIDIDDIFDFKIAELIKKNAIF